MLGNEARQAAALQSPRNAWTHTPARQAGDSVPQHIDRAHLRTRLNSIDILLARAVAYFTL
ncbi:MAG: hypothetical protein AABN95_10335 [Acidobacteriota bacterium]